MSMRARFEVPRDPSTVGRLIERSASRLPGKLALTFAGVATDVGRAG